MSDFQLQTEINDSMRREIDLYEEKWKIELEIEKERAKIRKSFKTFLSVTGLVIFINALFSYFANSPFNYFTVFIFSLATFAEVIWFSVKLHRKNLELENWHENPQAFKELNES